MKKQKLWLAMVIILALVLSSCDSNHTKTENGEQSTGKADKTTLVVVTGSDARTIDPHGAGDSNSVNALMPVVETLVGNDAEGNLVPILAEKWERIDDMSWKFYLRKGVKFHNGEELKASDVVFSFKRATSDKGANVQYIMGLVDPDGLQVVDDYTVIVKTLVPFGPFIDYLPYVGAAIISEKAYTDSAAELHPVGTGPFTFVEWQKGANLKYKKYEDYWGEVASFENLIIKTIPEANSRMIELETGKADIAINLTANEMKRLEESDKLALKTSPTTIFTGIYFNTAKAPFDNVKFRQGLDWAINAESIVKSIHRGAARYTPGPITPGQKYYNDAEINDRYDVEKAKQFIAESGVDLSKTYTITTNDNQTRIDLATIIQSQLKEVDVDIKIEVMETAAYYDYVTTGAQDICISGWGAVGFKDPDNNLYGPFHSSGIPENNTAFYANATLDSLLEESRLLIDGAEREKVCKEMQTLIRDDVPMISFDNPINIIGTQNYIEGFEARPTAHQIYNQVKIK